MKKFLRIFIIIILIPLVLLLLLELAGPPLLKNYLRKELKYQETDSIEIGSLGFLYFPLGIIAEDVYVNVHMPADSNLAHIKGNFSEMSIRGINAWGLMNGKDPEVGRIELLNGSLHYTKVRDTIPKKDSSGGGSQISSFFLRTLEIRNMDLGFKQDSVNISLNFTLQLKKLFADFKDSLQWNVAEVHCESKQGRFENVITDFDLKYESVYFNSVDSVLDIIDLKMDPRLTREEFAQKYKYLKLQPDLKVNELKLSQIDPERINKGLYAKKLLLDSVLIKIYQDTRKDRSPKRKPLLSESIAKIPFPVNIDSVILKRGKLDYHEKLKEDLGLANLRGDRLEVKIYPISNIGHSDCADVTLEGKVRFMEDADVWLKGVFAADKPDHDFTVEGRMGKTNMPAFNPVLFPLLGINIRSGECEGIRLRMQGNDYLCKGKLDLSYRNFKIALPSDDKERNIFGRIAEGAGNLVLVNSNNDYSDETGAIYYEREMRRPFMNYWWKGIESGLKDAFIRFHKNEDKK